MTHDEFVRLYDKTLTHGWVSSKDPNKAAEQKQREKEYNAEYYQKNKSRWPLYKAKADIEVAAADKADELLRRGKFTRKIHEFQIRSRTAGDYIVDEFINSAKKNAGASDVEIAAEQVMRTAEREAIRAIDAGKRMMDRLSGKSEAEVILNDLSRKAERTIEKAKPVVTEILNAFGTLANVSITAVENILNL